MKTIPKILRTFFTDTLETHQFAAVEFTLNQRLLTKVNCSCLDKAQNLPVEKIINAEFFSFGIRQRCATTLMIKTAQAKKLVQI